VTEGGTFEGGTSVLQLRADPADAQRFARVRAALLAARERRVRPGRDDKVVAAWNGLAIAALAEAGRLLRRPDFVTAAQDAAELVTAVHLTGARLARTSRDGKAGRSAGVLEDYACVAEGFAVLSGATGAGRWAELAGLLLDTVMDRFGDGRGGFYDTADDGEALIYRPADPADGPTPSGAFALAGALLGYAALTGSDRHARAAAAALRPLDAIAARYPRAAGSGLAVAEAALSGPVEVAIVGPPDDERTLALHEMAFAAAPPGAVIAIGAAAGDGAPGKDGAEQEQPAGGQAANSGLTYGPPAVPLLAGRGLVDGAPAAYVCRKFACRLPVTSPEALRAELGGAIDGGISPLPD
jgi:uncharacterized protein YyaL (SSP411 family)